MHTSLVNHGWYIIDKGKLIAQKFLFVKNYSYIYTITKTK